VCEAKLGFMYRYDGDIWEIMAQHGAVAAYAEIAQRSVRPGPETVVARIGRTKQIVQVADLSATQGYAKRDPLVVAAVELGGVRTLLGVPVLKEDELKGAIILYRREVRPFSEKHIELVQNFANQAVIAIENTRLLNELRQRTTDLSESLEQQMATSEVLQIISSSPGELAPVFQALLENAVRLCEAKFGILFRYDGDAFNTAALVGVPEAYAEFLQSGPHRFEDTPGSRAARTRQVVYVEDLR